MTDDAIQIRDFREGDLDTVVAFSLRPWARWRERRSAQWSHSGAGRHMSTSVRHDLMRLADLSPLTAQLDGVVERRRDALLEWRYRGRLVARQLDGSQVVIRASFDLRDFLLQAFPDSFSVPKRFAKHMMIVADLGEGNADAIEDAVISACELQSGK